MSFARSKRGNIFDDEIKNKENLPGPSAYNPRNSSVSTVPSRPYHNKGCKLLHKIMTNFDQRFRTFFF